MENQVREKMSKASVHDANGYAVGDAYAAHMSAAALREAQEILGETEGRGKYTEQLSAGALRGYIDLCGARREGSLLPEVPAILAESLATFCAGELSA